MKVKVLVVYDSISGNTLEMAKAVAKGAKDLGAEVLIKHVNEVTIEDLNDFDGFAFGSPTHCGVMSKAMNEFFTNKAMPMWGRMQGKVAAAFSSSGGLGGGNETTILTILLAALNYGMVTFGTPDYSAPGVTLHYGAVSVGTPKTENIKACEILGRRLAVYAKILKFGIAQLSKEEKLLLKIS
ncbi:MAG: flavodoxin domain-containing protein [Thermoproteota archaeon]|nr:flavodoxin domain-containing protein [Candidatus Brockarchaeota archaeon]